MSFVEFWNAKPFKELQDAPLWAVWGVGIGGLLIGMVNTRLFVLFLDWREKRKEKRAGKTGRQEVSP